MTSGKSRHRLRLRFASALLLAGVAAPVGANAGAASSADQAAPGDQNPEIIVIAPPLFPDIQPERNLDEEAIESYGVSTIDELLANLQAEIAGDDEEPLIIVNGERINDVSEIGAFPIEVLRNAQVLPRGSAVRVGGRSGQRLISLTLKRQTRTVTVAVAPKFATEGEWSALKGEGIFTLIRGQTRANVALRGRDETSLLESERGIIQPDPFRPYAISGNVIGFPNTTGEIDPLLSALAGEVVTVAPIPSGSNPTLAEFAAGANVPATTDLAPFRTLRPDMRNYDLNATVSTRLAPWLTSNATIRLNRSTSDSLRGLASALLVLPQTNPASPFSRDVGLAFYGADALHSRSKRTGGEGNLTFNGRFGNWTGNLNAKHNESRTTSRSERGAQFGSIVIEDSVNPFAVDPSDLINLTESRASSRSRTDLVQLSMTGPAATLPAGALITTFEGRLAWYRLRSESTFQLLNPIRNFRRSEQAIRAAVDIPLTSRSSFLGQFGDSSLQAEYSRLHFSDAGTLDRYALGLIWEPVPALRLRASIQETDAPPIMQFLGDPTIVTEDVRMFDALTGDTVDVTQITGGNPELLPEKLRIKRLTGILRLVPRLNLQLNAEYTDTDRRDFVSSLPEASAPVMLAFPDRFVRSADGVLAIVDLRPVNFDSDREKRLRWGVSMNAKLRGGVPSATTNSGRAGPRPASRAAAPGTFFQLTANHSVVFSEKIVIRPGLPPVDLLGGGAIGLGGGRLRHQVDGTAAITKGGLGARLGLVYRGKSTLDTRIGAITDTVIFDPFTILNIRAFADLRQVVPSANWAKGLRLSIDVLNITNDRQRVRDSSGNTPLQYQPAYRDPLGRTIEFEIRKVF